jgi:hypothetical protein
MKSTYRKWRGTTYDYAYLTLRCQYTGNDEDRDGYFRYAYLTLRCQWTGNDEERADYFRYSNLTLRCQRFRNDEERDDYFRYAYLTLRCKWTFWGVQHHYEWHWKGWALKIETFLGPEMALANALNSSFSVTVPFPCKGFSVQAVLKF